MIQFSRRDKLSLAYRYEAIQSLKKKKANLDPRIAIFVINNMLFRRKNLLLVKNSYFEVTKLSFARSVLDIFFQDRLNGENCGPGNGRYLFVVIMIF